MSRKRYTSEQIISMLREAEVALAQGQSVGQACRTLGVSEQSYYRWRKEYGGLRTDQAKRLKDLEKENGRLRVSLRGGPPSRISVIRRGCAIGSGHLFGVHQGLSGHDRRCRKQWRIRGPGGKARVPFVVAGAMPRSAGS